MTDNIVDITNRLPHYIGVMKCLHCHHSWEGTLPITVNVRAIPCPQCNLERGVFATNAEPRNNEMFWICNNCEGDVFYVVTGEEGPQLLCASCAERTPMGEF